MAAKFAAKTGSILGALLIDPSKKENRQRKLGDDLLSGHIQYVDKEIENQIVAKALARSEILATTLPSTKAKESALFDYPTWTYSDPPSRDDFLDFLQDFNNVMYTNMQILTGNNKIYLDPKKKYTSPTGMIYAPMKRNTGKTRYCGLPDGIPFLYPRDYVPEQRLLIIQNIKSIYLKSLVCGTISKPPDSWDPKLPDSVRLANASVKIQDDNLDYNFPHFAPVNDGADLNYQPEAQSSSKQSKRYSDLTVRKAQSRGAVDSKNAPTERQVSLKPPLVPDGIHKGQGSAITY